MNVCLECQVFNALGVAVCRPQSLAGRWAGRRAERRIAWPWRRRQCKFFVLYCVGKMFKSVSVFLKCTSFQCIGGRSVPPPASSRALGQAAHAQRRIAWPWRRLLFHFCGVVPAMRSIQNRDAWIQELMFQLRIFQAGPLK